MIIMEKHLYSFLTVVLQEILLKIYHLQKNFFLSLIKVHSVGLQVPTYHSPLNYIHTVQRYTKSYSKIIMERVQQVLLRLLQKLSATLIVLWMLSNLGNSSIMEILHFLSNHLISRISSFLNYLLAMQLVVIRYPFLLK